MRRLLIAASAAALALPAGAQDAPVTYAEPTSQWQVDYGEGRCAAGREFDTHMGNTILMFEPMMFGRGLELMAILPEDTSAHWLEGKMTLQWDDDASGAKVLMSKSGKLDDGRTMLVSRIIIANGTKSLADPNLAVQIEGGASLGFHLASWAPLWKALDTCLADLRQDYGVTQDMLSKIVEPARYKDPDRSAQEEILLNAPLTGGSDLFYLIDERGRIDECRALREENDDTAKACEVLSRHYRFKPAKDGDGQPVPSPLVEPNFKMVIRPMQIR